MTILPVPQPGGSTRWVYQETKAELITGTVLESPITLWGADLGPVPALPNEERWFIERIMFTFPTGAAFTDGWNVGAAIATSPTSGYQLAYTDDKSPQAGIIDCAQPIVVVAGETLHLAGTFSADLTADQISARVQYSVFLRASS